MSENDPVDRKVRRLRRGQVAGCAVGQTNVKWMLPLGRSTEAPEPAGDALYRYLRAHPRSYRMCSAVRAGIEHLPSNNASFFCSLFELAGCRAGHGFAVALTVGFGTKTPYSDGAFRSLLKFFTQRPISLPRCVSGVRAPRAVGPKSIGLHDRQRLLSTRPPSSLGLSLSPLIRWNAATARSRTCST